MLQRTEPGPLQGCWRGLVPGAWSCCGCIGRMLTELWYLTSTEAEPALRGHVPALACMSDHCSWHAVGMLWAVVPEEFLSSWSSVLWRGFWSASLVPCYGHWSSGASCQPVIHSHQSQNPSHAGTIQKCMLAVGGLWCQGGWKDHQEHHNSADKVNRQLQAEGSAACASL